MLQHNHGNLENFLYKENCKYAKDDNKRQQGCGEVESHTALVELQNSGASSKIVLQYLKKLHTESLSNGNHRSIPQGR